MPGIDHPTTFRPVDDPGARARALAEVAPDRGRPEPHAPPGAEPRAVASAPPLPRRAKNEPRPARATAAPASQAWRRARGVAPDRPGARPARGPRAGCGPASSCRSSSSPSRSSIALFVSGVFGADDPTPSLRATSRPPPAPARRRARRRRSSRCPGADDASGAAVEAREGARPGRERRSTAATPDGPPPPAPRPRRTATTPAAAKPKARERRKKTDSTGTGGATGIDASNGATGAEQLPAARGHLDGPRARPAPGPGAAPSARLIAGTPGRVGPRPLGSTVWTSGSSARSSASGRALAAAFPSHRGNALKALDDRAMDLAAEDAELRAALFRFVDVVPACRSLDDLAAHLTGYLEQVHTRRRRCAPRCGMGDTKAGRAALGAAGAAGVRHMAHRFIVGADPAAALPALRGLWHDGHRGVGRPPRRGDGDRRRGRSLRRALRRRARRAGGGLRHARPRSPGSSATRSVRCRGRTSR